MGMYMALFVDPFIRVLARRSASARRRAYRDIKFMW